MPLIISSTNCGDNGPYIRSNPTAVMDPIDGGGINRSEVITNATKDDPDATVNNVGLVLGNLAVAEDDIETGGSAKSVTLDSIEVGDDKIISREEGHENQHHADTIPKSKQITGNTPLKKRAKGIVLILMAILSGSVQGGITKYLKDTPTGEFIEITGVYSLLFFCIIVTFQGIPLTEFPLKKLVFIRVMFSVVVKIVKIWSFQNLPLGDATALIFTSPLFACIFGRIFLKEKLTLPHFIALILGIIGIVLIAKPTFLFPGEVEEARPWYYNSVPILGAVNMGIAYTVQRRIGTDVNCITISVYMIIAGNIGGLGFQTIAGDKYINPVCYMPRFLMVLSGLMGVIGLLALNKGLYYEKAATVSLMRNCDTVLAFLIQVAVFSEPVEPLSLVGTALIMAGTLILALSKLFDVSCRVAI